MRSADAAVTDVRDGGASRKSFCKCSRGRPSCIANSNCDSIKFIADGLSVIFAPIILKSIAQGYRICNFCQRRLQPKGILRGLTKANGLNFMQDQFCENCADFLGRRALHKTPVFFGKRALINPESTDDLLPFGMAKIAPITLAAIPKSNMIGGPKMG